MEEFIVKHQAKTTGMISCFDRLLFKGYLPISYPESMETFLNRKDVLLLRQGGRQPEHGRIVRVPIDVDRRVFTPLPRDSKSWTREYKHRTAIERVNNRYDVSFGFERHFIRGMKKMQVRAGLALLVMLGMAVGWSAASQRERICSLVGHPRAA